jgi:PAS domain S-box-containing protein
MGSISDITGQKVAAECLTPYRQPYHQAILNATPDLMLRVRRDGTCLECIQPQADWAGIFLPIKQHLSEVLSPHLLQQELQNLEQALTTGEVQVFEHSIEKYGQTFYEEVRTSPLTEDEALLLVRDITAQKQAEIDRDRLFNLSLDLICVAGFDGYFQRLNPAWENVLGYSQEELMAVPYIDFVHPDDRERTLNEAANIAKGLNTLLFQNRYRCRDGSYRWLSWNATPVYEEQVIYCVTRDITERKLAELALSQSEERYRSLVSNLPGAVYRCQNNPDWTIEFLSEAAAELCGYPATDFMDSRIRTYTSIIHPEDRSQVNAIIQAALEQRQPFDLEYRIQHRNGDLRWVYERGQGVFDGNGGLSYLDGVIFDITDRKRAEAALTLAEANYRSIFENALQGIYQSSPDGFYLCVNSAMARIHGYESPEQMMAMVEAIDHQIYVDPACRDEFVRLMAAQGEVMGLQYQVYRRDRELIWVEENARAVHDADGNLLYYEGFIEDISDRKREETALRSQLQALRIEIDQQKRQQDVAQVMQTDYFQQLQADVDHLRYQDPP